MRYVDHFFSVSGSHQREKITVRLRSTLYWKSLWFVNDSYVLIVKNQHIVKHRLCQIEVHFNVVYIFISYEQLLKS